MTVNSRYHTAVSIVITITLLSTGAAAMIYEVVLLREFTLLLGSSFYSGSIVLASIMGGLAMGSLIFGKLSDRTKNPFLLLLVLEMLIALIALVIVPVTRRLALYDTWTLTDGIIYAFEFIKLTPTSWHILLFYSACILLIPAVLMGGELPIAINILSKTKTGRIGEVSGYSYFLDTLGGIIGAISAGFIMIPLFGSITTAHTGGILNTIGAVSVALFMILFRRSEIPTTTQTEHPRNNRVVLSAIIIILVFFLSLFVMGYYKAEQLEYTTVGDLYRGQVILDRTQSRYQSITVIDHDILGRVLFLDGQVQISESDDEPYSEALVFPAAVTLLNSANKHELDVLIIGGGDLGVLEVLTRFPDDKIANITLVDLDPKVIEIAKQYLVSIHNDSWQDHRYEYVAMDGRKYIGEVLRGSKKYDLVILDLPDPNNDLLATFYSLEFYNDVYSLLDENGMMATQATQADWALDADGYVVIANTLRQSQFPIVRLYRQYIPSFGQWGFAIASKHYDPLQLNETEIAAVIAEIETNTYSKETHFSLFALPPWLLKDIDNTHLINTIDKPVIIREF
ncbi:putative spermidine synthase with an N-terminal membrane domain [Methanophagales archaeon]|nr:putative spermidine synthase with an N-terminal membrane domain [Methanophagales archaeon]